MSAPSLGTRFSLVLLSLHFANGQGTATPNVRRVTPNQHSQPDTVSDNLKQAQVPVSARKTPDTAVLLCCYGGSNESSNNTLGEDVCL